MSRTLYRFGDCRIDLSARELRRAGELVVLSPKVFDCLAYLIERRERAVGRDELVAAVWGRTEITDTLLGQTILKARRAIGDSADEQKAIRTIPRFGYAWVAALDTESPEREAPPAPLAEAKKTRVVLRRSVAWFALAAFLAAVAILAAMRFAHRTPAVAVASGGAAVLPVEVSAPAEWSWVRLGLMDAIASRLREGDQPVVPSDNVIALARAATSADHRVDVRDVTGATLLVVPSASWNPSGWNVHLEAQGKGSPIAVDARDADVLLAGRAAADRLLALLGKTPPGDTNAPEQWANAKLLQRAEAALLTDDLDGARRLLQSAPESLKASPEYGLRLARLDFRTGDFDAADRRLHALLAETPVESDAVLRARIRNGIGHVALRRGQTDAAKAAYAEAASLLRDRNEPAELGQAYMGLGSVAQIEGRYDDARAGFSQAHVAFELAGDALALARVEANEGMLDAARDRHAAAAPSLDRAAQRFEQFGTLNELAMTTSAEIDAWLALLAPKEALAASERAWPFRERLSNPRIAEALSVNRALALDANGRRGEALALLQHVVDGADPARASIVPSVARGELARIALTSGQVQEAADLALAAIPALAASDDARDALTAWLAGTRALRGLGRADEAAAQVDRLDAWARSATEPAATRYASLARAEQQAAEKRDDAARAEYERALRLAVDADVPADVAEIVVSYGTYLIAAGELERATAVVGQAARWTDRDLGCALLQARLYAALGQHDAWQRALAAARTLAGEREIPADLTVFAASGAPGSP
jgi:DNA-binding winged helix-turn-helix (wHTH) protein/tetratricopeptide (TPR) repeat protein